MPFDKSRSLLGGSSPPLVLPVCQRNLSLTRPHKVPPSLYLGVSTRPVEEGRASRVLLWFVLVFLLFFSWQQPSWCGTGCCSLPQTSLHRSRTSSQFRFCLRQQLPAVCQTGAGLPSIFTQVGDPFIDATRDHDSEKKSAKKDQTLFYILQVYLF